MPTFLAAYSNGFFAGTGVWPAQLSSRINMYKANQTVTLVLGSRASISVQYSVATAS